VKRITSDADALDLITYLMDGKQWSVDTLDQIAQVVRETERPIADLHDEEEG
jgi:hypothetical protein